MAGGWFKWSVDEMVPDMRPGVRYMLMTLYAIMTLAFFIAVIAYGVLNSAALLTTSTSFEAPTVKTAVPVLNFPAVTICPVDTNAALLDLYCSLVDSLTTTLGYCNATSITTTIQGTVLPCLQYNGKSSKKILQSSKSTNSMRIHAAMNATNTLPGEPSGAFVIVHAQSADPVLAFDNTFIATPDYFQYVMLYNKTVISRKSTYSNFSVSVSKSYSKESNESDWIIQPFDVFVLYPEQVAYIQTQTSSWMDNLSKGRFITEAGGLAALLLFLHRIVMWVVAFPLHFCCHNPAAGKGEL
eukprot:GGOE01060575.1.p1 GENE.GGOE01060575.1~~GGOE01060575.1.p1  ORF type:complete len:313 (-),score=101.01 GGOE01060575.1:424-1317(-)